MGSTTGSVTLNRSSANYWRIDIYYSDGSRVQMASTCGEVGTSSISGCSGRYVSLTCAVANSSTLYVTGQYVYVTGSTITRGTAQQASVTSSGIGGLNTVSLYIIAVVGWKV